MPIGALNPCPFRVGGGQTPTEKTYQAMKRAVGVGGSARDETGIDGLWRLSRARGVAAASSATVRACHQFWPLVATDAIPYYARALGLVQETGEADADFAARVYSGWVARIQADVPHLLAQLQTIDSRVSILEPTFTTTTQHGRAFAPLWAAGETPAWGLSTDCSIAPNYSTDFVLFVQLDVGHAGAPTAGEQRIIEQLKGVLLDVLPSWVDFRIVTDTGFILDTSSLDITGFGA